MGKTHLLLAIAAAAHWGCSSPRESAQQKKSAEAEPARITQFYASPPNIGRGEKTLLCYGVESAKSVSLTPPEETVWPAATRCFDVSPSATATYTLTAEDSQGRKASQAVTVTVGPARPRIVSVDVSSLAVKSGDSVRICFQVANAKSVTVAPLSFRTKDQKGCTMHAPAKTTTYTVSALGEGGAKDTETFTVNVSAGQ
ncbi:MAG: hypothetical protein WD696_02660 [Bryobacteraceae bacterium]